MPPYGVSSSVVLTICVMPLAQVQCRLIFARRGVTAGNRRRDHFRFHVHRAVQADGPAGNVVMMRAPVRDRAAGIIKPPAKLPVASLLHVIHLGSLAEPEVPIQFLRAAGRDGTARRATPPGTNTSHLFEFADAPVAHQFAGQMESLVAALLRAGLEHNSVIAHGFDDVSPFVNRQRERLFSIYIFLGFCGGDVDERVPMIRACAWTMTWTSSRAMTLRKSLYLSGVLPFLAEPSRRRRRMIVVHIANRHDVALLAGGGGIVARPGRRSRSRRCRGGRSGWRRGRCLLRRGEFPFDEPQRHPRGGSRGRATPYK